MDYRANVDAVAWFCGRVMPLLRADYPRDPVVRAAVEAVVRDVGFLGRTDVPFAALGVRTPPRGMRWWWTALTGEELDGPRSSAGDVSPAAPPPEPAQLTFDEQLTLDDVHEGYG